MKMAQHPAGTFCWVDLATTDGAAAKKFYCDLFGWTPVDMPTDADNFYTMLQLDGDHVCAMWEMGAEMQSQGVPPHWQSYVSVDDVDAVAGRAAKLGATLIMPPFDVMQAGRMAVLQDPTGATVALWQRKDHCGAQRVNEPGSLCWNELQTRDVAAAEKFYGELFGWKTTHNPSPQGGEYVEIRQGDRPAGGMLQIQPEWGDVPPNWRIYFAVADCDAALAKATGLGAKALTPPIDIPGTGRFVTMQDPQGAAFAMIALEAPDN